MRGLSLSDVTTPDGQRGRITAVQVEWTDAKGEPRVQTFAPDDLDRWSTPPGTPSSEHWEFKPR